MILTEMRSLYAIDVLWEKCMPTLSDLVSLALKAARETKRLMISTNDIIPRAELPVLSSELYPSIVKKYGERAIEYMRFLQLPHRTYMRDMFYRTKYSQSYGKNWPMVTSIALSKFGVGECGEHAYVAAYTLLKNNYHDFYICSLHGTKPTDGLPDSEYLPKQPFDHALIIMNAPKSLQKQACVTHLEKLSDDVIVLDPFLKYVGHANRYREDMKAYLGHFSITRMEVVQSFSIKDLQQIADIESKSVVHAKKFPSLSPYQPPKSILVDREVRAIIKQQMPTTVVERQPVKIYSVAGAFSSRETFFHDHVKDDTIEALYDQELPLLAMNRMFFKPKSIFDTREYNTATIEHLLSLPTEDDPFIPLVKT